MGTISETKTDTTVAHTASDFDSPIPYALRRLPPELVEVDIHDAPTSPGCDLTAEDDQ